MRRAVETSNFRRVYVDQVCDQPRASRGRTGDCAHHRQREGRAACPGAAAALGAAAVFELERARELRRRQAAAVGRVAGRHAGLAAVGARHAVAAGLDAIHDRAAFGAH